MEKPERKLYRSRENRWIAGVCGGIAERLNISPNLVRAVVVVGSLFTLLLALVYGLAWLIIPVRPDDDSE